MLAHALKQRDLPGRHERKPDLTEPLYAQFARILTDSIKTKQLKRGTLLLEGRLAELFGSSRAPVREALAQLRRAGLISRFDGRGHIVGPKGVQVLRTALEPGMIHAADSGMPPVKKSFAWQAIYESVERAIIYRSAFGRFRVNEYEVARHHGVSRTVAHDVLARIEGLGMLEKDTRQRWTIVPLDDKKIANLYQLRELLEPVALRHAMPHLSDRFLDQMRRRHAQTLAKYPDVTSSGMDDLEFDLHIRCFNPCPNKEILASLAKTRCILTLSKHVLGVAVDVPDTDPFMAEHLEIIDALIARDERRAMEALLNHLKLSAPKVTARLHRFRDCYEPPAVPYIA